MELDEISRQLPGCLQSIHRGVWALKHFLRPASPATQAGMGAIPHENGTAFRVWAPNADKVLVAGTFNGWSQVRTPLAYEDNGYWSADVAGVGPGDQYKFVIRHTSHTLLRTDPYARDVASPHDNAIISNGRFDWGETPYQTPAWNEMVIYELHVGTFHEKPDGPPGNFQGVIEKLPYLQALGVNTIELMPVKAFPGNFSWGYNPAHPFAVTSVYGGRNGLKQLVRAAHEHGIAVILDVVYNHFGPDGLSLWQFDGWHQDNMGGIYFYNDWRSQTPWADTRPDYGRQEVRQYIRDNVLMWLEEFQVDGLRWDATSFIRTVHGYDGDPQSEIADGWRLMQWVNDEVDGRQPWKLIIAEDLQNNAWITRPTEEGGAGFDSQWDASFVHPLRHVIITAKDEDRDMEAVGEAIAFSYNGDGFERVIYTESHDEVANGKARVSEEIASGEADSFFAKKRSTLGAAIVFTAPGIPMIFQGQEFLEDGWFDDQNPLDWQKAESNAGILKLYRDLIELRRNRHNTTRGLCGQHVNVHHTDNDEKVIAFHRWFDGGPEDDVIVVANFSNRVVEAYPIGFPHAGTWRVRFNSDLKVYDESFGDYVTEDVETSEEALDGMAYQGNVSLGPYTVVIFSQSP